MQKEYAGCYKMKFFSVDGAFYRFITTLWDVIRINFLWILFSLPIITFGASTVAAFSVTNKMAEDKEGYVARQFVKAFRENWKQGIPMGLLFLLTCYVVYLDFELFRVTDSLAVLIFGILACVMGTFLFLYSFALSARYENTLKNTLMNSLQIAIRYFPRTIGLVVVLAVELLIFFFNTTTLFFLVLIGPACIIYTISGFSMYIFRRIESDNKA